MKRFTALFLALVMILSLCPVTALAEELPGAETDTSVEEVVIDSNEESELEEKKLQDVSFVEGDLVTCYASEEELGYTDEEAFAAYVQREFDEALGIETPSFYSSSALTEDMIEKELYDKLKPMLAAVADGDEAYPTAEFSVNLDTPILLTEDELGVEEIFVTIDGDLYVTDEAVAAIRENVLDFVLVWQCLLADCPLELYWHDKSETGGLRYGPQGNDLSDVTGDKLLLTHAAFSFAVSADYSVTGETGTVAVDTDKTSATSTAVENAVAIVEEHAGKGNYAKLKAYKDEICDLVAYDDAAADDSTNTLYGDPWQMIRVFDDDKTNKVVCEGYSKAFQYLCDLSEFETNEDPDYPPYPIECHTVYGDMAVNGGSGGAHMWNVVTMDDGQNYLVDVTNCDGDPDTHTYSIGYPDGLFMTHASSEGKWVGKYDEDNDEYYEVLNYTITLEDGSIIDYTYDEDIGDLFGVSQYLSQSPYYQCVEPVIEARWSIVETEGELPTQWESGTLFEAVSYANELSSGTAYIQLIADVTTDYGYYFWEDTNTILDLNGYTIDLGLTETTEGGSVIDVGGDLTLCDSSTTVVANQGKITGGYSYSGSAGGVTVSGTFTMDGGIIVGNNGECAGGVEVFSGATFIMNGGMISENAAIGWEEDTTMYEGLGGGVCVDGGYIDDNGTEIPGGTFIMTDGEISGNSATTGGGGVFVAGEHDYNGETYPGGTFLMSGGVISENEAAFGAGVDASGAVIMSGGEISGNIAVYNGGGVYTSGTMSVSGEVKITGNTADELVNNVFLGLNIPIMVTGALTSDAAIGVDVEDYPSENTTVPVAVSTDSHTITQADAEKFFHDSGYTLELDNESNAVVMVSEASDEVAVEAQWGVAKSDGTAPDEWVDSGTVAEAISYARTFTSGTAYIQLLSNIKIAEGIPFASGKKSILDLNGKTIDRELTTAKDNGSVIFIHGDLTICDTSANKNGKITGAYTNGAGAIVLNDGSAFTLTSGNISGNNAPGVTVWGTSEFNMTGGTISGNTAPHKGGGVVVEGTFNMSGGTISGNTANEGGGVEVRSAGTFTMSGGVISGNNAKRNGGGGVYNCGTMNVSGAPIISGNVKNGTLNATTGLYELGRNGSVNNVYLQGDNVIAVTNKLNDGTTIGVAKKLSSDVVSVTIAIGSNYTLNDADAVKFVSDAGYVAKWDKNANAVVFAEKPPALTGTSTLDPGDVMIFNDMDDTKLSFDGSNVFAMYEDVYFVCDEAKSYTLYLAEPSWYTDTFTVTDQSGNPVPMEVVGTMDATDGLRTVYALKVDKPASGEEQTVSYTMTRSWHYLGNNGESVETEVEFTLTFDFAPVLTVKLGAGTDKVKIFDTLDTRRGVLSNDGISPHDGFLVASGGKTNTTVYLAVAATDALAVSYAASYGDVPMEHVGTYIEGIPHRVYAVTAEPPANGDGFIVYNATCWYRDDQQAPSTGGNMTGMPAQTIRLICDFYLKPGDLVPFTHNGLRIYGTYEDKTLGYLYPDGYDDMAYNDTANAVQVPGIPNQNKSIYLVSSKALSLVESSADGATLEKCNISVTNGYTAYSLTVPAQDYGTVVVSNGEKITTFDFWFDSVVFTRTSFFTTNDFSYENRETCDGLMVEEFEGDIVLKVPYTEMKEKELFIVPNDGDITDVAIIGGGLGDLCAWNQGYDGDQPLPIYSLTLSEDVTGIGNVMLALFKENNNGEEYIYDFINVLFVPYYVEVDAPDYVFDLLKYEQTQSLPAMEGIYGDAVKAEFADTDLEDFLNIVPDGNGGFSVELDTSIAPADTTLNGWVEWVDGKCVECYSAIKLYYGEGEDDYCLTEEVFVELTATLPKVTAKAVKFNSFFWEDARPVVPVSKGSSVIGVALGADHDSDGLLQAVSYNETTGEWLLTLNSKSEGLVKGKGSDKVDLEVLLDTWRAPAPVTVSVSAASTAPQLKVAPASVNLASRFNDGFSEELTITCAKDPSVVGRITLEDTSGAYSFTPKQGMPGVFTMTVADESNIKNGKITLTATIAGGTQTVPLTMTAKVTSPTLKAETTKVALNTALSNLNANPVEYVSQKVELSIPNVENPREWFAGMTKSDVQVLDKSGKTPLTNTPDGDLYCFCNTDGILTISATENTEDGTYKVRVTVPGTAKPVDITVTAKATLPKLQLSTKSVTINHAMGAGVQKAIITVDNTDLSYDDNEVSVELVDCADKLEYDVDNNKITIWTKSGVQNIAGSYKVNVTYTMPNDDKTPLAPITVKVENKPPVLKTATKSLSLDVEHGIAMVDVSGLAGSEIWELRVATPEGIKKIKPEEIVDNTTFTVKITDEDFKSDKITVYGYNTEDGSMTKAISITVKPVKLSATASVKGNMDVSKPNVTMPDVTMPDAKLLSNFTFKYTGLYLDAHEKGEGPALEWEVKVKENKSAPEHSVASSTSGGWFKDIDFTPYGVSLAINTDSAAWSNGQINPKYTYNVYFTLDFDGVEVPFTKPVKMTVKQGSVKFAAPKTVALGEKFSITCADSNVADIAAVAVSETATKPSLFEVTTIKDEEGKATGEYRINLKDASSIAKSGTVKLNIWLEGNYVEGCEKITDTKSSNYHKPNATVSLKVTVQ